jgi:hypothetical protein
MKIYCQLIKDGGDLFILNNENKSPLFYLYDYIKTYPYCNDTLKQDYKENIIKYIKNDSKSLYNILPKDIQNLIENQISFI